MNTNKSISLLSQIFHKLQHNMAIILISLIFIISFFILLIQVYSSQYHSSNLTELDLQLIKLQIIEKMQEKSLTTSEKCKYYDVRSTINEFLDNNHHISNFIKKKITSYPILFQTSCMSSNSFGNSVSEYIETRLCARLVGLHYIDIDLDKSNQTFVRDFPSVIRHENPISIDTAKSSINSLCGCPSICHEWVSLCCSLCCLLCYEVM